MNKTPNPAQADDELFDELISELANYWYQEEKYTPTGRWIDCKNEARRQLLRVIKSEQKCMLDKLLKKPHMRMRDQAVEEGVVGAYVEGIRIDAIQKMREGIE